MVIDAIAVAGGLIGLVDQRLQFEYYVRISLGQGDTNVGQSLTKPSRIQLEPVSYSDRPVNADQIIVVASSPLPTPEPPAHGTCAQQIDLYQMRLTGPDFFLLVNVQFSPRPRVFVGRADYFDNGNDAESRFAIEDSHIGFVNLQGRHAYHNGGIAFGESDSLAASIRLVVPQPHIWSDFTVWAFHKNTLFKCCIVSRSELGLQLIANVDNQGCMHS